MIGKAILVMLALQLGPFSVEEITLAQILQGEAHHQFMLDEGEAAYHVGWVARNRLETGRYGATYQEVKAGFPGTIEGDPGPRYVAIARLVMSDRDDPTGGCLYVFSQQDVDRLAFDQGKATLILRALDTRALFFFRRWPGD